MPRAYPRTLSGNAVVDKGLGTCTSAARSDAVAATMSMRLAGDEPPRERLTSSLTVRSDLRKRNSAQR
jgi:hypothetical protein